MNKHIICICYWVFLDEVIPFDINTLFKNSISIYMQFVLKLLAIIELYAIKTIGY